METFYRDRARQTVLSYDSGTGDIVVSGSIAGYQRISAPEDRPVSYGLIDGTAWEVGKAKYTFLTGQAGALSDRVREDGSSGSLMAPSVGAICFMGISAADMNG